MRRLHREWLQQRMFRNLVAPLEMDTDPRIAGWQARCTRAARREGEMLVKVYGGTTVGEGESLCDTCRHSRIVRGRRLDEEIVFCDALCMRTIRITFKVTSCTDYVDDREPSYHELMERAWILRPASKRRAAGFVRATDLRRAEMACMFEDPTDPA